MSTMANYFKGEQSVQGINDDGEDILEETLESSSDDITINVMDEYNWLTFYYN